MATKNTDLKNLQRSKRSKRRDLQGDIVDLLHKDPTKKWGAAKIAEAIGEGNNRTKILYHLKQLREQGVVEKDKKKYFYEGVKRRTETDIQILQSIGGKGTLSSKDLKEEIRNTLHLTGPMERKVAELVTKDLLMKSDDQEYHISPRGAKLINACFVCGKPLGEGMAIMAQDIYVGPGPFEEAKQFPLFPETPDDIFVHSGCLYDYSVDMFSTYPRFSVEYCDACNLPLGLSILFEFLVPKPDLKKVLEDVCSKNLTLEETEILIHTHKDVSSFIYPPDCLKLSSIEKFLIELDEWRNMSERKPLYSDQYQRVARAQEIHAKITEAYGEQLKVENYRRDQIIRYFFGDGGTILNQIPRAEIRQEDVSFRDEKIMTTNFVIRRQEKKYHPMCLRRQKANEELTGGGTSGL